MKTHFLLTFAAVGLSDAQTLCGQFDYFASNPWYINNNEWGAAAGTGTQCTYVDSVNSGGISWHTDWTWSGGNNNVKSYPYSGRQLTTKKLVRDINSIPTVAEWRYEKGNNIRANVAYDLFTAEDPNHETSSGDYELMIWLVSLDHKRQVANRPPIGCQDWGVCCQLVAQPDLSMLMDRLGSCTSVTMET